MSFRPKKKQPQFADLKGVLSQSKKTDNALYQTVVVLVDRLTQLQGDINEELEKLSPDGAGSTTASKLASYHTKFNEVVVLPNSVQLLAGAGIAFNDTIPNQRTISAIAGGAYYDCPLSDGDLIAADLIFAAGECIIVQVPV